jgi:hypothetical protein
VATLPRFLLDPNINNLLAAFLRGQGHDVERVEIVLGDGTPDDVVAAYAASNYQIIVTRNVRHFETEAARVLAGNRLETRSWGLIGVMCREHNLVPRFTLLYDLILAEYQRCSVETYPASSLQLHMDIHDHMFSIHF